MALGTGAGLLKLERPAQGGSGCWKGTALYLPWGKFSAGLSWLHFGQVGYVG